MTREQQQHQERIVIDPDILVGEPVAKGTRRPVELDHKRLAQDLNSVISEYSCERM